jgi:Flp pilus assembly protein TadG
MKRFFADDEGGQALILGALMFLALLFFVGLAVDAGQLYVAKRTEQEAADSAAFAGAVVIYQGNQQPPTAATVTAAKAAAVIAAAQNGYVDDGGVGNMVVTVSSPPTSGNYSGDVNHVEVTIVHKVQTSLVPAEAAFNPVRARGVAGAESFNNGYALMALDQSCTAGTMAFNPNEDVHLVGGGALVNSCSNTAVTGVSAGQDFTISPAGYSVDVVGNVSGAFPAGITVNTGIAPVPDPFAGYPKPSTTGKYWGCSACTAPVNSSSGSIAYEGVWTSAIDGMNLCHGIYILKGSGLGGDIGRQTTGTDPNSGKSCDGKVFLFNTMSNYPASSGGSCSQIGRNGNHPILLRPMTDPPDSQYMADGITINLAWRYTQFQIYQDTRCTADVQIGGNQTLDAAGTIYVPNACIHLNGNPATIDGGQLIAKCLDIQNGNLNINYSANNAAQPRIPRLAE